MDFKISNFFWNVQVKTYEILILELDFRNVIVSILSKLISLILS